MQHTQTFYLLRARRVNVQVRRSSKIKAKKKKNKLSNKAKSKFLPLTEKKRKESSSLKKETQIQDSSTYKKTKILLLEGEKHAEGRLPGDGLEAETGTGRVGNTEKNRRERHSGQTNMLAKGSSESSSSLWDRRCEQL